jgi:hypothetical protein
MVLEYVIIGLVCFQIVLGIVSVKFLADLLKSGLMELVEDFPPAIAEAFAESNPMANMEGVSPIQMAIAELIGSAARSGNPALELNTLRGDDGKFTSDNM